MKKVKHNFRNTSYQHLTFIYEKTPLKHIHRNRVYQHLTLRKSVET